MLRLRPLGLEFLHTSLEGSVSFHSSHHPHVLLAQFSLYVHNCGIKFHSFIPDSSYPGIGLISKIKAQNFPVALENIMSSQWFLFKMLLLFPLLRLLLLMLLFILLLSLMVLLLCCCSCCCCCAVATAAIVVLLQLLLLLCCCSCCRCCCCCCCCSPVRCWCPLSPYWLLALIF